jgi:hypothetical protein
MAATLALTVLTRSLFQRGRISCDTAVERFLRHAAVDRDDGLTGRLDHALETLSEEPIALQQVAQSAFRVAGCSTWYRGIRTRRAGTWKSG